MVPTLAPAAVVLPTVPASPALFPSPSILPSERSRLPAVSTLPGRERKSRATPFGNVRESKRMFRDDLPFHATGLFRIGYRPGHLTVAGDDQASVHEEGYDGFQIDAVAGSRVFRVDGIDQAQENSG